MDRHYGHIISKKNGFEIINCTTCGFIHVYPFPSQENNEILYSDEYYQKNRINYIKNLEEDCEWWGSIYKERVEKIASYLKTKEKINVLDIGTGAGYFLNETKKLGWEETGIEPSHMASSYGIELDLNIIRDFYTNEVSENLGEFQVIHMNHVLEHMIHVKDILKLVYNNLASNGVFCVAVPNDFNQLQLVASEMNNKSDWWITPLEHINYFNFESLSQVLDESGFEILDTTTSFPMELFVLMGENYIGKNELGRSCHKKRKEFEKNLFKYNVDVKNKLYRSLAKEGLGRDVIIFAKKKEGI